MFTRHRISRRTNQTPHPLNHIIRKLRLERPEIDKLRPRFGVWVKIKSVLFQLFVSKLRPERPERLEMRGYAREYSYRGSGDSIFVCVLLGISSRSGRSGRNLRFLRLFSVGCKSVCFIFSGRSPPFQAVQAVIKIYENNT